MHIAISSNPVLYYINYYIKLNFNPVVGGVCNSFNSLFITRYSLFIKITNEYLKRSLMNEKQRHF